MQASEFSNGLEDFDSLRPKSINKSLSSDQNHITSYKTPVPKTKKKDQQNDKVFRHSLFRQNPMIPNIKQNDVIPIHEPLFSKRSFKDFNFHPHMISNLEQNCAITQVTAIQERTFPILLEEQNALIRSQTGSGKTLAYAIPIIEKLHNIRPKLNRSDGLKVIIVLPTRELAIQTYEWFVKLVKPYTWLVPGLLIGGEKRKSEKARLRKGITILIGTPGRLLDHAKKTISLTFDNLEWLIIDEADRLLELGYEKDVTSLIELIDKVVKRRRTVLLSATLTKEVEKLVSLSLQNPVRIDVVGDSVSENMLDSSLIIPNTLDQYYIIVSPKLRLVTLASVLIDKCSESTSEGKILVFMGTQSMVDYHAELLATVLPEINFYKLHGKMSQVERTDVFKSFRSYESGVLLCSDVVARGLDLPQVDWIIQYNAPVSSSDYVHRVGRTARVGTKGNSTIFLAPHEIGFISMLQNHRVKISEAKMEHHLQKLVTLHFSGDTEKRTMESAATTLQVRFETAVLDQELLHVSGCEAFISWARFYASYPKEMRNVFNFKELHLGHFAKSFALRDPPKTISGIGKPKYIKKQQKYPADHNRLSFNREKLSKRKQSLSTLLPTEIMEFESGMNIKKRKKRIDIGG